jgi:ABC-2 type transport system ATP-binding protein
MNDHVLEVKNLTKIFGKKEKQFKAVDDISFSMKDGEILGLLGPNGAGKTTTLHMLIDISEPTSGRIIYFGKTFIKHREEILSKINFSSTYIDLPWLFTVEETLNLFAKLYEVPDRKKRITKLCNEFELNQLLKKQFYMLSAGEKTRLLLAKAFINYPRVILLDEPTASLDPEIAVKIRSFLKREREEYNTSILLTSHNMEEVEEMCDRVIVINKGKIIAEDTPENLTRTITECEIALLIKEQSRQMTQFLEKNEIPFEKNKFHFTITIDENRIAEFLMLLADEQIKYQEISIKKPNLEDFFLHIIQKGENSNEH